MFSSKVNMWLFRIKIKNKELKYDTWEKLIRDVCIGHVLRLPTSRLFVEWSPEAGRRNNG